TGVQTCALPISSTTCCRVRGWWRSGTANRARSSAGRRSRTSWPSTSADPRRPLCGTARAAATPASIVGRARVDGPRQARHRKDSMNDSARRVRVAVLGCGVVGTEVVRSLVEHADELHSRTGTHLDLVGIGVRSTATPRDPVVPDELLTEDLPGLVRRADLVVELLGGIEPARELILDAIGAGASVVTANKALLAAHGPELYEAADARGVDLYFEAAVAGAVPVVRGVRESFAGDRVTKVLGVVNGTTNFILDEMTSRGVGFGEALADAQALGYAEADPTADIDGHDAAAKIAILASLAFHTRVSIDDVPVEGIRYVTADDVEAAGRGNHVIKLLAVA